MKNNTLKLLTLISKTADELYPGKYIVAVDSKGSLGLYYPEAKRIVSPIAFGDDGSVLTFNNCNDLMDDFINIENVVNLKLKKMNMDMRMRMPDEDKNNDSSEEQTQVRVRDNFYVLKLGNWFMDSINQLTTYPNPKLTDNFKGSLVFTDDDMEDEFKDAVEYYLDKGFKLCKINFEEV